MNVKAWCITGAAVIFVLGSLDHFLFEWSGNRPVMGLFAPVNESVWEHLKMGYWGMIVYSPVEYFNLRKRVQNYFLAKFAGILTLEAGILISFYTYTSILGKNLLLLDIATFVVGVILCQVLVYHIFRARSYGRFANIAGAAGLCFLGAAFAILTFIPPQIELFRDSRDGSYGIQNS